MRVKIIASLGPASLGEKTLRQMSRAGMDVVRLKASFFSARSFEKAVSLVRGSCSAKVMADLEGQETRVYCKKSRQIKKNGLLWIGFEKENEVFFNHDFFDKARVGDRFVYDKGKTVFLAKKKLGRKILFKALGGLKLENGKEVSPLRKIRVNGLSFRDLELIEKINKLKVEYAALSFTQNAAQVSSLKKLLHARAIVCAKIEDKTGVKNRVQIAKAADVVMVARGDLSAQLGVEKVPQAQEKIINSCHKLKKPVIVATDFLSSMEFSATPRISEANDLALSVEEGASMVLLEKATAVGEFPVETVKMARKIIMRKK